MSDTLTHRGPDDSGAWLDERGGPALRHRRLSILDLSAEGHQPMRSPCGCYVLVFNVFNGEIYNFRALREELEPPGHPFRGHSDTEVMLAAFRQWGLESALSRFNGMFAFALWDAQTRTLSLARDWMGEKPFYYGRMGRTFLFGSELKALRAHPDFRAEVDRNTLALYLRYSYVPASHSIYRGLFKLSSGAFLRLSDAGAAPPEPVPYWSVRAAAEAGLSRPLEGSPEEALESLEELLRDAVRLRMEADVPVGAFLSGGVDSSAITALMQAQSAPPVRTFTIGFHEATYNEAEQARAVAAHLGTEHTDLYVTPQEAREVIPLLPRLYDEPFADSSRIPTFLVSALARRHVTVTLSGDSGDELFGGYNRYVWVRRLWRKTGRIPFGARHLAARGILSVSPERWERLYGSLGPALRHRNPGHKLQKFAGLLQAPSPAQIHHDLVSQWKDPCAVVLGATEPLTLFTVGVEDALGFDDTERMMYWDSITYLPDDILVKVDRASMEVSLEERVPYPDHRLVEYAWRIPLSMKIQGRTGKWLLRRLLYRHVPQALIERPKMGFSVPVEEWQRAPLCGNGRKPCSLKTVSGAKAFLIPARSARRGRNIFPANRIGATPSGAS